MAGWRQVCGISGALTVVLGLSACASLSPKAQATFSQPVEMALTERPPLLRAMADQGGAIAQLAYSYVLQYGLNGADQDAIGAAHYRFLAVQSRGTTTTAIYVPGALKMPGHTQLLTMPRFDLSQTQATTADKCAAALWDDAHGNDVSSRVSSGICGGRTTFVRLKPLWKLASER